MKMTLSFEDNVGVTQFDLSAGTDAVRLSVFPLEGIQTTLSLDDLESAVMALRVLRMRRTGAATTQNLAATLAQRVL